MSNDGVSILLRYVCVTFYRDKPTLETILILIIKLNYNFTILVKPNFDRFGNFIIISKLSQIDLN